MAPFGGFDHNAQALRIVTNLERHYADFDGLNLTWETLEGIAKHNGPVLGTLPHALMEYDLVHDLNLHSFASAEAQVAAISDDIAYNNHDIHDGLRANLFADDQLESLELIAPAYAAVDAKYPKLDRERRRHEALRRVFGAMVEDVIAHSQALLAKADPQTVQDIRDLDHPVIQFSPKMWRQLKEIRTFLFARMYRAPRVMAKRAEVTEAVDALFPHFLENPSQLPSSWQADSAGAADRTALARIVADYIAGMTDRYAVEEHRKLFSVDGWR